MVRKRRKGFTLIELLVVIAIIAILAAMLFPVFARARESARKIQCLSNVKNIAIAFQMYLSDYDRMAPAEHRSEVVQGFNDFGGTGDVCCCYQTFANPYLQWPVVLDEYVKNRDVWRCPSARFVNATWIYPGYADWYKYLVDHPDLGLGCRACGTGYPTGWGGSVTDSFIQAACAGEDVGAFNQSIGVPRTARDLKTAQLEDPSKWVVAGEVGYDVEPLRTSRIAYPDRYGVEKADCQYPIGDWANCSQSVDCGANDRRFQTDVDYRKKNSWPRHLGGANIGFADGHAAWMSSETILFSGRPNTEYVKPAQVLLLGVDVCGFGPSNQ